MLPYNVHRILVLCIKKKRETLSPAPSSYHEYKALLSSIRSYIDFMAQQTTSTWTRQDKQVSTFLPPSNSGPLWTNVVNHITIDNNTGKTLENLKVHDGLTNKYLQQPLPKGVTATTTTFHNWPSSHIDEIIKNEPAKVSLRKVNISNSSLNVVLQTRTLKKDLVKFYHAACMCPIKTTWICNSHFLTWKRLTEKRILKYFLPSVNTAKGHMRNPNAFN